MGTTVVPSTVTIRGWRRLQAVRGLSRAAFLPSDEWCTVPLVDKLRRIPHELVSNPPQEAFLALTAT